MQIAPSTFNTKRATSFQAAMQVRASPHTPARCKSPIEKPIGGFSASTIERTACSFMHSNFSFKFALPLPAITFGAGCFVCCFCFGWLLLSQSHYVAELQQKLCESRVVAAAAAHKPRRTRPRRLLYAPGRLAYISMLMKPRCYSATRCQELSKCTMPLLRSTLE